MPRQRGQPSPSPTSRRLCAPPDFMPTRTCVSRQCLPIQVPVCPHNTFVHLAWQIGAHAKMGKKTLRPGWQIWSVFPSFFCEGAAHSYLVTAALKRALQESFGSQILHTNSLNFVSMFGAVGHLKIFLSFLPIKFSNDPFLNLVSQGISFLQGPAPCYPKARWSVSTRHTTRGRILTQVLDPSLARSCDDTLRGSDLKQAALPRADSTCPYRCQEVALSCQ